MFKNVVWATDGSEAADRALTLALELAQGKNQTLHIVHYKELFVGRAGGYPLLADEVDLQAKIQARVEDLRKEGFDAKFELVTSSASGPAQMIAEAARDADADVIVVGTRGHSAIGGLLLGSVTQRLLHISHCPVLAVPPGVVTEASENGAAAVAAAT